MTNTVPEPHLSQSQPQPHAHPEPQPQPEPEPGEAARTVTASVGPLDELEAGTMKMVPVGEHKVALIRTSTGVYALDNPCPHQGYGLVTGELAGDVVTCQWHNWKFDVTTGRCLLGEEDVACHRVAVDTDGQIEVAVTTPSPAEERERLWPSLERGLAADYVGQVSRDALRLLDAGATSAEIMARALTGAAPKADYGVGHELAMAADCLAWAEIRTGDDQLLPLIQGLSGLSEETRDRPPTLVPAPDASIDLVAAIEAEDITGAMAATLGQVQDGAEPGTVRHQFITAATAHHLGYGHGMIYTQKAFELLDRIGWDQAPAVLPHLAETLGYLTREDLLPYMVKAMRALARVDLDALAAAPDRSQTGWSDPTLAGRFLAAPEAPIEAGARAVLDGAGIEGLLDTVVEGASLRLLAHDLDIEFDVAVPFGWLDITHVLTLAQAARWAWRADPGPHTARAALFALWLLFDSGRQERHLRRPPSLTTIDQVRERFGAGDPGSLPAPGSAPEAALLAAVLDRQPEKAVALALAGDPEVSSRALAEAALGDRAGSFIVVAHLIKTAEAAAREATEATARGVTGSEATLPLAATARFLAAPRLERFVARNVAASIDFIRTGRPPRR